MNHEESTTTEVNQHDKNPDEVIIKEGTMNAQNDLGEWVPCHVIVTKDQGITLQFLDTKDEENKVYFVLEWRCSEDVEITMLPDHARRSRESKLYPFAVRNKKFEKGGENNYRGLSSSMSSSSTCRAIGEVILATSDGREMWGWASAIQYRGRVPKEEQIPLFHEPSTTSNHNKHYENSEVLQAVLLKMFTYKNLPMTPVRFEDLADIDHKSKRRRLCYIDYPDVSYYSNDDSFFDEEDEDEDEDEDRDGNNNDDNKSENCPVENDERIFGLFAYLVLVGSCVQVHEKCFELITSSNLYDMSSQVKWKGNSPMSMLCEGDYNSSRTYLVRSLWRLGYPSLEGFYANYNHHLATSIMLAKPSSLYGISNVTGEPVHPDDQKLCRLLRDKGDGKEANTRLTNQLIRASQQKASTFETDSNRKITSIHIPKSIMNWGCAYLTDLDLSGNGIFELPDELYDFTSLTRLSIESNCLFGLSHKLGNLTNLTELNMNYNLITELPDTIEKLDKITSFHCYQNPITKPPKDVCSRGIDHVRNYFKDMRESGTEVNVDLRILVLGLSEAGKTSLVNGLINPDVNALTRVGDRTVGIEKRTWSMPRGKDKQPANLLTYDFAGQEEYYITHHLFLGNRALYVLAFDLYKFKSDNKVIKNALDKHILLWWDSIQDRVCDSSSTDSKTPKVIIVGTHADMVDDAQSLVEDIYDSLKALLKSRMKGLEDRLKEINNELKEIDPRRRERKNEKHNTEEAREKEYEALPAGKKAQIIVQECEIDKLEHQKECAIALPLEIQAVSSKDMFNFDKLRYQIASSLTEIGPTGKYFPQLDEELPRSWFQVRKFVREQSTKKGRECMKLPQYFKLLSDELGMNEDVGRRATHFCHDLGDVLFFDKEGLVFLRPSFLIDVFKLVIRHDHKESTYWTEKMLEDGITESQFNAAKELLLQKGQLEEWLLDVLWSQLDDDIGPDFNMKNNLIQLLETFDIATPIEHEGCKILSIPEFQPQRMSGEWSDLKKENEYEIQRWICVDRNLPRGLLKRLQVRLLKSIFKRSSQSNIFDLAQDEFKIKDRNSSTAVYCVIRKRMEGYPGSTESEGFLMCIRGDHEKNISSMLSKASRCLSATLKEYPGIIFNHYDMQVSNNGSFFRKVEDFEAKQSVNVDNISLSLSNVQI